MGPKTGPGRLLTEAEVRQRVAAGKASALARHRTETAPSIRQGSTGVPSRQAVGLFQQGQARPDTRARRGVWDTRSTEPTVGSVNARFTMHFPSAYRSASPDPVPKGRGMLAGGLARKKTGEPRDLVISNPQTIAEAHRHPEMRDLIVKAIGVVRDHQVGAIERGQARGLIPEGTRPGVISRAYKHAALLALHKAGLGDYDFNMDETAKKDFAPLTDFMRYAHRRVFDQLNVATKGKWVPFRDEFGQLHIQRKHGKETGVRRMRMRPNDRFVKIDLGDLGDEALEKVFTAVDTGKQERKRPGKEQKEPENGHDTRSAIYQLATTALARAQAMHQAGIGSHAAVKPVPPPPKGDYPHAHHPDWHMKDAARAVERHFGVKLPRLGKLAPTKSDFLQLNPDAPRGASNAPREALTKVDLGWMVSSSPSASNYNVNPATQLRRAMRPRMRRRIFRVRLNTQRHLRRVLGGGVTRQERWQIGASSRIPSDPFGKIAKRYLDKPEGEDSRTWDDGRTKGGRALLIAAARRAADPTDAQAAAGNYRMGHARCAGFDVTIETPKGRWRHKIGRGGKRWRVKMPAHYGYLKRTEGADGDHLDVYLGPHAHEAEKHSVYVVDQQHADTGRFDEHKAMLGFKTAEHATKTYDAAFSDKRGPERRRAVHEVTIEDFRHWVGNADTTKPYAMHKQKDDLRKGIINAALTMGARLAPRLRPLGVVGARVGRQAGAGIARTRMGAAGIAGAKKVAAHPAVAPAAEEVRSQGWSGFFKSPVHSGGRVAGRLVGRSERAAKIGGTTALALDYAPPVVLGAHALGLFGRRDKQQKTALRQMKAGSGVQRVVASELGKGLLNLMRDAAAGKPTASPAAGAPDYMTEDPAARGRQGGSMRSGAVALASRAGGIGRLKPANRTVQTSGIKDVVRQHLRILEGGSASPYIIAQVAAIREKIALMRASQKSQAA